MRWKKVPGQGDIEDRRGQSSGRLGGGGLPIPMGVGGGGLGYYVVAGFSQAQLFGKGLAAGIAITALGVMLDRTAQYAAARYGRR